MSNKKKNAGYDVIRFENETRAKAFLRKVRDLDRAVEVAMRQIDSCEASATRITPYYSHTASRPNGNSNENKIINLIETRENCNKAVDRFADYKSECLRLIDLIPSATYRQVLALRYIDYFKWEKIEKIMHYSESHIFRLHGQALEEFEKVLETSANYGSK